MQNQIFYDRPYSLTILFIYIAVVTAIYSVCEASIIVEAPLLLKAYLKWHVGIICTVCFLAIILDPSVFCWSSMRTIGGNVDGTGESGGSVQDRQLVTVVRPIIGFGLFEYQVETVDWAWIDGKKHEKAILRM